MADVVSPTKRSEMMSGIKRQNSLPEMLVRQALFAMGYRYRLHRRDLPGTPDIALPGRKIAIFVHGCFWHVHEGCRFATIPATRPEFWKTKLLGNVARDEGTIAKLAMLGWRALVVWECATRAHGRADLARALSAWIDGNSEYGEIDAPPRKRKIPARIRTLRNNVTMTSIAAKPPTVDSLAIEFCNALRATLTLSQMLEVVALNHAEPNRNVCHSHDFCDANMVLHEVFLRHGMDLSREGPAAEWIDLWNQTWDLAKSRGFRMFRRGDKVEILEGFKDPGDDEFTWIVQDDEAKGRVDIVPVDISMEIKPRYAVQVGWIRLAEDS